MLQGSYLDAGRCPVDRPTPTVVAVNGLLRARTGLSFTDWRTRVRLSAALEHMAAGRSVAQVARRVGYATPSAFVAAFRRQTGRTPGDYFARGSVQRRS
ncbi:MAG TPA: helix-turn-helix domain-containing protein [Actinocatenispora sp.]